MAATVSLSSEFLEVVPGETGRCELAITNTGRLVDQFTFSLVGDAAEWVTIEPPVVNLMPAASATAAVVFKPPRSAEVTAGRHPFGVRVGSREEPAASVVEEGAVEVAAFQQVVAELVPAKRRAKRRAKFRLAVDNLGNTPTPVEITLHDPEDELRLETDQPLVTTAPGTATIVKVRAIPHRRFLRGQPRSLPFQVVATGGPEPVELNGVVQQEQLIPKWLLPALVACAVLVVAAIGAWYALLKPAVVSTATEQTQQQVAKAETAASKATAAAQQAGAAATVARQAAGLESSPTPGPKPSSAAASKPAAKPSPTPAPGKASGTPAPNGPVSFRIATSAKVVTDGSFTDFKYTAPDRRSKVDIADLVLQNPRGDNGILRIAIGTDIVLETGLANFRDLDYHYLEPLHANPGQPVVVSVNCTTPGTGSDHCTPSVSFSGKLS
ncbi:COG1470 family protein [Kribbella monticola]|uniref:COG1470 family protein n=1 Tax=Kribbella monticola TaxID=2185285 RepID=UPI00130018EF|nr:hypothetical protein [Kribbella monticola]